MGKCVLAAVLLATLPGAAFAYVGPGAGLSALGSILAFLGVIVLLIVGFVWYPVKRLLNRGATPDGAEASVETIAEE